MRQTSLNAHRQKFRKALAILRGIEALSSFKPQSNVTRTQWAAYLEGLYRDTYRRLFEESDHSCSTTNADSAASGKLGGIFSSFSQRFFDANGFFGVADTSVAATELALLYQELMACNAYGEDTSLVTRLFFTLMGEMRGFREKLGGIDFRRLSSEEVETLRSPGAPAQAFLCAMQRGRDPQYPSQLPPHPQWPDFSVSIEGLRFLKLPADSERISWYPQQSPQEVIVLCNGKLVGYAHFLKLLTQYLESGELLGNWRVPKAEWIGELKNLPTHFNHAAEIDYQDVTAAAMPLCLSLHPFTHLSYTDHHAMDARLKSSHAKGIMALAEEAVEHPFPEGEMQPKLKLATARIRRITTSLKAMVEAEITAQDAARANTETPLFLMTMGGSGSGKNSNRFYRQKTASHKFVYTSLDDGRAGNDIYHVLVAAGHHADDYEAVHLWADMRRNWLCEAALRGRMHVIYDGSGIDYQGRYDAIIRQFAAAGYQTEIIAADCMLVVPEARRDEFPSSALERVMRRAGNAHKHNRSLPWRVVMNKHIGFPRSFLAAFRDENLQRLCLVDNARGQGKDDIVAQMFSVAPLQLKQLQQARTEGKLKECLNALHLLPEGITADSLAEEKLDFLAYHSRVLVITDAERMVDILEKGQLNPNAHSPQALTWLKRTASFLIDRFDKPSAIPTIPAEIPKPKDAARSNYLRLNSGE